MAQVAEQLLQMLEVHCSNPIFGKVLYKTCSLLTVKKTKIKRKSGRERSILIRILDVAGKRERSMQYILKCHYLRSFVVILKIDNFCTKVLTKFRINTFVGKILL